jgi:subfamily B ATP-binding cassette protein MsbA
LLAKLRFLLGEFPQYRAVLLLLVLLGLVGSLAESFGVSLIVLLLGMLISGDIVEVGGALGDLYAMALRLAGADNRVIAALVLSFILTKIAANIAYGLVSSWLRHSISEEVRARLFQIYLDMPFSRFKAFEQGTLHETLALHSWALADALAKYARIGANICSIVVFAIFVVALSLPAAIIAAIGSLLIIALVAPLGRRVAALGEASLKANAVLTGQTLAELQAMRTIRAFALENWAAGRFKVASRLARSRFEAIDRLQIIVYPLTEIGYLLLLVAVALSSAAVGISNAASLAAVLLLYRLQPHLRELESNRLALAGHSASTDLVRRFLEQRLHGDPSPARPYMGLGSGIAFEKVTFRHEPNMPLIDDFEANIPASGLTILTGTSGSGKTTIINLLLRLYEPQNGRILIGGEPIASIARRDWLANIAIAGQDIDLIPGDIALNIRFGRLNASEEELWYAAEKAGLADTIRKMPYGLKTDVGERGTSVSGGQRQRIGLARALVRNPDILILDEATNAVEHQLEASILAGILQDRVGKITMLITHRNVGQLQSASLIDLNQGKNTREPQV